MSSPHTVDNERLNEVKTASNEETTSTEQARVGFSMRNKLTIAFVSIVLLSIGLVAFFVINTTRSALTDAANQNLLSSAQQVSTQIDDYLEANLSALQAEAQLPAFRTFVTQPEESRTTEQILSITNSLQALKSKDPYILSYSLLTRTGNVVADSRDISPSLIPDYLDVDNQIQNGFESAMLTNQYYISPVRLGTDRETTWLYFASPIQDLNNRPAGLLVARYQTDVFQDLLESNTGMIGEGSYGVLYSQTYDNYIHLAHGTDPELTAKSVAPLSPNQIQQLKNRGQLPDLPAEELSLNLPALQANLAKANEENFFTLTDEGSTKQVAVVRLENKPWLLAFYQPRDVFLAPVAQQTTLIISLAVIVAGLTVLIATLVARSFTAPITSMVEGVHQIEQGNLEAEVRVNTTDEIGLLADAFNNMTTQLKTTLETLEKRIARRTQSLAQRAVQIQTTAELARDVTTIREQDRLLTQITHLIADRFGYYHVGIFLINRPGTDAVLEAANSPGGQRMLERGHKLAVGEVGIVGYVAGTGEARIALDVGEDATYFDNPDLPETRSEIALPLMIENEVMGVLDVQSKQAEAFTQEDLEILQVLADQIAIALDNARLLEQSQAALEEIETLYGEQIQKNWQVYMEDKPTAYRYTPNEIVPQSLTQNMPFQPAYAEHPIRNDYSLYVPITIRGQTIGSFTLERTENQPPWTEDDLELVTQVINQIAVVLETTRLLEETQQKAIQEQMTSQISTELRQTLDMDTILQTAARTIGDTLNLSSVKIQMASPEENEIDSDNGQ